MKKKWLTLGCFLIVVLLGIWAYNVWFGTTKIAFVNFQTITMGGIAKANDNSFIKLQEVPVEELDRLSGFDICEWYGVACCGRTAAADTESGR